ncbi:MAG: hypothetical protein HRU04_08325 [Oceanospirillaceae bacterium]|nr:hypothetical protein [Oceanospirillaceae bacterium]
MKESLNRNLLHAFRVAHAYFWPIIAKLELLASVCYVSGFAVTQADLQALSLRLAVTTVGQVQTFSNMTL